MKAKRNFKIKLLVCCMATLLLVVVLAACNQYTPDHYDYLVTFDYNLGKEISGNAPNAYLGLLDPDGKGSLVGIRPGYNTSTFREASIAGYYLEGWYEPLLDAENELQYEDDGRVKLRSESFDFEHTRIHENITLYANLVKSPRMLFVDADTDEVVSEVDGRRPGESFSRPTGALAPKKVVDGEPYTFMGEYYATRDCDEPFDFSDKFGDDDVRVYCKFIKGEWSLVRTAGDFNSAINRGQNIYLMNDITFTSTFASQNYNGELNGNGYTIRGAKLNYTERNNSAITKRNETEKGMVGLFKTLLDRAYIHDITFEEVTIDIDVTKLSTNPGVESFKDVNIGMLAAHANAGARVENVTISGTLTCNAYLKQCVDGQVIPLSPFIAGLSDVNFDKIVNCDYSGVKVIYLS